MKFVLTTSSPNQKEDQSSKSPDIAILINLDFVSTIHLILETAEALVVLSNGEKYLFSESETISLLAAISSNDIVRSPDMGRLHKLLEK